MWKRLMTPQRAAQTVHTVVVKASPEVAQRSKASRRNGMTRGSTTASTHRSDTNRVSTRRETCSGPSRPGSKRRSAAEILLEEMEKLPIESNKQFIKRCVGLQRAGAPVGSIVVT